MMLKCSKEPLSRLRRRKIVSGPRESPSRANVREEMPRMCECNKRCESFYCDVRKYVIKRKKRLKQMDSSWEALSTLFVELVAQKRRKQW